MSLVATLMGACATELERTFPGTLHSMSDEALVVHPTLCDLFTYPAASAQQPWVTPEHASGKQFVNSHQVAVRMLEPTSVHRHLCALLCDHTDGQTPDGMPLLYFNRGRQEYPWMGDLLVFESASGGRAARVRTA